MKANYKKKSFLHSDEIVSDMKFCPERGKMDEVKKYMAAPFSASARTLGKNSRRRDR
jgi:hypothetical protein